jgi:hypothetical protein
MMKYYLRIDDRYPCSKNTPFDYFHLVSYLLRKNAFQPKVLFLSKSYYHDTTQIKNVNQKIKNASFSVYRKMTQKLYG